MSEPKKRSVRSIALEIAKEWDRPHFGAVPHLRAMVTLRTVDDRYGEDDGRSIVRYFLANANTFRGADARRLKAELRTLLGES